VTSISMVGTHAGIDMEGEDTALSILKFANGVVGTTRHTWASPRSRVWYTLTATCQKAHLTLTTKPLGDLTSEGDHCPWRTRLVATGETEEVLLDSGEGLDVMYEMAHFLDCVETGATPATDGPAARRIIELVLAAYEDAAQKGANV
jgi:predicted dehydrogenase